MFVPIDVYDQNQIMDIHCEAMKHFRFGSHRFSAGTSRYIFHKVFSNNENNLLSLTHELEGSELVVKDIKTEKIIDSLGVYHCFFNMEIEEKVILEEVVLTQRVLMMLDLLEEYDVIYHGWETAGSNDVSSNTTEGISYHAEVADCGCGGFSSGGDEGGGDC